MKALKVAEYKLLSQQELRSREKMYDLAPGRCNLSSTGWGLGDTVIR